MGLPSLARQLHPVHYPTTKEPHVDSHPRPLRCRPVSRRADFRLFSDQRMRWNRNSCMYDGKYEPGEEDYAEAEAKRLNKASTDRLRRSSGD